MHEKISSTPVEQLDLKNQSARNSDLPTKTFLMPNIQVYRTPDSPNTIIGILINASWILNAN
jgi:hypothetical protein